MYPLLPRLGLGFLIFSEIYFIVLLNHGVGSSRLLSVTPVAGQSAFFSWWQQHDVTGMLVCGFTVFSFLFWLRIADDFKDYELDCRLFATRPLPAGRVYKKDLRILAVLLIGFTLLLNLLLMNNFLFCLLLYTYGSLMAVWFFQKHKIARSLPLALVTHNPVQIILNLYIISYVVIKYQLPIFDLTNAMAVLTLYFPALIWEVSRKIRAPQEETEYVTYSKLFGYRQATNFVLVLTWVDLVTNIILVWQLNRWSVIALLINAVWITVDLIRYKRKPTAFRVVAKVERYTYILESMMILTIVLYLLTDGRIS
ncbi:MAG: prenyltransferase [Lachnospiraceae bacterium]|nr:prenyltransferase [Lachnospiraceae bacterium]MDY5742679.1 prenyltransferase [Lachnospiraceae bacterium]